MTTHLIQRLGLTVLIFGLALAAYCPICRSQGTPFNGFEFGLPATIKCEQFNRGGLNVASFHISKNFSMASALWSMTHLKGMVHHRGRGDHRVGCSVEGKKTQSREAV
jgi:hypothetical protein